MRPILFYVITLMIFAADQVSKWAVITSLPLGASRPVIGSVLSLTHTHNTGGAFSLFQARNGIFIVVACIAIVALLLAYHRYHKASLGVSAALALALGGAIGNVTDRVRFGYVIDFFDIHVWPIFNIADSAISVGIIILAIGLLRARPEDAAPKEEIEQT